MDPCDVATLQDEPEDILSASLQSLYRFSPFILSSAGSVFTYPVEPGRLPDPPNQIEVITPDTQSSNWSLHASSIWVSSFFIADHIEELHIGELTRTKDGVVRVLELGAGAGLPSILLARMYRHVSVTLSDYPDDRLIRTLSDNIRRNAVSERCRAVPHAWGTDPGALVSCPDDVSGNARFHVVFAADTLWNPGFHAPLLDTLCSCLKHSPESRIHLVAGLHTGRYTIQSFLDAAHLRGLVLQSVAERQVDGTQSRPWVVGRAEGEDELERRGWVVWIILKWGDSEAALESLECTLHEIIAV